MINEMTLREKVWMAIAETVVPHEGEGMTVSPAVTDAIATLLEDTGAPAHMRVAAELRGLGDA